MGSQRAIRNERGTERLWEGEKEELQERSKEETIQELHHRIQTHTNPTVIYTAARSSFTDPDNSE